MPELKSDSFGMLSAQAETPAVAESKVDAAASTTYSDSFTGTDGSVLSSNWAASTNVSFPVYIYNNTAAPSPANGSQNAAAVWAGGAPAGQNRIITTRLGPGGPNRGVEFGLRYGPTTSDFNPVSSEWVRVVSMYDVDGVTPKRQYLASGSMMLAVNTSDSWHRCFINGNLFHFYSSTDGENWTWRNCTYSSVGAQTGNPFCYFHTGAGPDGTSAMFFDDFNMDALPTTVYPNLLTPTQATTVCDTANGWTVEGSSAIITTGQIDPLGGTSAVRTTVTGYPVLAGPSFSGLTPGTLYTLSTWMKRVSGNPPWWWHNFPTNPDIYRSIGTSNHFPLDTWVRYGVSWVQGSDTSIQPRFAPQGDSVMDYWGLKIEASPYPSGTAADIASTSAPPTINLSNGRTMSFFYATNSSTVNVSNLTIPAGSVVEYLLAYSGTTVNTTVTASLNGVAFQTWTTPGTNGSGTYKRFSQVVRPNTTNTAITASSGTLPWTGPVSGSVTFDQTMEAIGLAVVVTPASWAWLSYLGGVSTTTSTLNYQITTDSNDTKLGMFGCAIARMDSGSLPSITWTPNGTNPPDQWYATRVSAPTADVAFLMAGRIIDPCSTLTAYRWDMAFTGGTIPMHMARGVGT